MYVIGQRWGPVSRSQVKFWASATRIPSAFTWPPCGRNLENCVDTLRPFGGGVLGTGSGRDVRLQPWFAKVAGGDWRYDPRQSASGETIATELGLACFTSGRRLTSLFKAQAKGMDVGCLVLRSRPSGRIWCLVRCAVMDSVAMRVYNTKSLRAVWGRRKAT